MIEIAFEDSTAGLLKAARIGIEQKDSDVVCLALMLDVGDISKPIFGEYRADLIGKMLYQEQWGADREMKRELENLEQQYAREYERLIGHLKRGESVRLWTDGTPCSICGELWLSDILARYGGEVCAARLPRIAERGGAVVERHGWGECSPKEAAAFMRRRGRVLTKNRLLRNSFEWQRLKEENSPLRALITGRVASVPANFYDFMIWRYLGDEPTREGLLIGTILGKNYLGVGDWWYAYRIEKFIREGRITVVADNERKYARVIAKS